MTRSRSRVPISVLKRQFAELAPLRRYISSMVPFSTMGSIVEPGCGPGLLAGELDLLTGASYTGIDIDGDAVRSAKGSRSWIGKPLFLQGDAREVLPSADAYVSSFFLTTLTDPDGFVRKVGQVLPRDGLYIVYGEYDYRSIAGEPCGDLARRLLSSLMEDDLSVDFAGRMDSSFQTAGFTTIRSGSVDGDLREPDAAFLRFQLGYDADLMQRSGLKWRIVWGIYRKK